MRIFLSALLCFVTLKQSHAISVCAGVLGNNDGVDAESSAASRDVDGQSSEELYSIREHFPEVGFEQSIDADQPESRPLYEHKSKYQDISLYSNRHYGKILVLDGVVQITERDADSYNEMMAHIPLMEHVNPKRVLVIGGGDGYVLHEVLKHASVEVADHVDLDGDVIEVCREHFKWGKTAWADDRVKLHIQNGATFLQNSPSNYYDVVIQDSSDPFTFEEAGGNKVMLPSSALYTQEHFVEIFRVLRPGGFFNFQAETFHLPSDLKGISDWRTQALEAGFHSARYGSLYISSYPLGQIGFLLCSKTPTTPESADESGDGPVHWSSSATAVQNRFDKMVADGKGTSYYWPPLQNSAFDLPMWVHNSVYGVQTEATVENTFE